MIKMWEIDGLAGEDLDNQVAIADGRQSQSKCPNYSNDLGCSMNVASRIDGICVIFRNGVVAVSFTKDWCDTGIAIESGPICLAATVICRAILKIKTIHLHASIARGEKC